MQLVKFVWDISLSIRSAFRLPPASFENIVEVEETKRSGQRGVDMDGRE